MDTSETYKWYEDPVYIKMCDCEEIQGLRQWAFYDNETHRETREGNHMEGDVLCADGEIVILGHTPYKPKEYSKYGLDISMVGYDEGDSLGGVKKLIWLPTQSQLQGMVNWKAYIIEITWFGMHRMSYQKAGSVAGVVDWVKDDEPILLMGNSMEQLWIQFYKKEEHGKVWSDGKWIKN